MNITITPPRTTSRAEQNQLAVILSSFVPAETAAQVIHASTPAIAREAISRMWLMLSDEQRALVYKKLTK